MVMIPQPEEVSSRWGRYLLSQKLFTDARMSVGLSDPWCLININCVFNNVWFQRQFLP